MSTSLTTLVPVLDGTNWTAWCEAIQAYLMSQGQWYTIVDETLTQPGEISSDGERAEYKAWKDDNLRAMGNISLRCSPSVRQYLKSLTTAKEIWAKLKDEFGKPGLAAIFAEFRAALELSIPASQHPQAAIQKLNEHFERLASFDVKLPAFVHGMLLASKAPAYADFVVQLVSQSQKTDEVDPKSIGQAMVNAWDQRQGRRKEPSNASRITAIKRKPGEPTFKQQQSSQRPQGQQQVHREANAKTKRGKRGGKSQRERDHAHFASVAFGPREARPPLESRIEGERPVEPSGSQYPRFKRAIAFNTDLGVPPSFERIRVLEEVLDAAEPSRPSKRSKSISDNEDHVDWGEADTGKVSAGEEDAVSLGEDSDYEEDLLRSIGCNTRDIEMQ